jgi:alpha-tubulin suppressor-like RCC1 family protein
MTSPTLIENTTDTVSLSVGNEQSCVAKGDGTVWCWGHVFHGEAGWVATGTTTTRRSSAVQMTSLSSIVQVTQSANSACGRRANGDVLCWGEANVGQLGDGTYQPRGIAAYVRITWQTNPYAARVAAMASSWSQRCAILTDRRVACWGSKGSWYAPTSGYKSDTTLEPGIIPGVRDIVDLYIGPGMACALQRTGRAWCWGNKMVTSQFVNGVADSDIPQLHVLTNIIAVSHGGGAQVYCLTQATNVATCYSAYGNSSTYQLPTGATVSDVGKISSGHLSSCVLKQSNGQVWCWGDNSYFGQLGIGFSTLQTSIPQQITSLSTVQALSQNGSYANCALLADSSVKCWGQALVIDGVNSGGVGTGGSSLYATPVAIPNSTEMRQISTGMMSCGVKYNGTVWCWGVPKWDVLGSITPWQIVGITDAVSVNVSADNNSNTCVLRLSGEMRCWGMNVTGMLADGTTTYRSAHRPISEPWQANVNRGCELVDWQGRRHFYESLDGNWTWTQARDMAAARTWRGNNGYLATLTSPEENRCVHQLFMKQESRAQWPGMLNGLYPRRWLGGSDVDSEGTWKWMTGPEAGTVFRQNLGSPESDVQPGYSQFQKFSDSCKPDCASQPNWDYLQLMFPNGTHIQRNQWNDEVASDNEVGAIVEYTTSTGESARTYTTTTDSQGNYMFDGLAPGVYTVQSTTHGTSSTQRVVIWPDQRDERVDLVNRSVTTSLQQTMTAQPTLTPSNTPTSTQTSTNTPTVTMTPTLTRTPIPPNVVSTVYSWNNTDNTWRQVAISQANQIGVLVLHTADGRDYSIGVATFNGVNYTRPAGMPQANSSDRGQNYDLVYWNLSSLPAGTYDLYYDVTTGSPTGGGGFEFFVIQGVDPINPVLTSAGYTSSSGGIPSINLTTTRMNSLLFDFFFTASSFANAGMNQTQLYQLVGSTYGGRAGVSYKIVPSPGTHNMTQSTSSSNHSYFAMALNPEP